MKKFIALVSVSLCFGFALALANTEDSAMNRDSASDTSNVSSESQQQAGSAGISSDSQTTGSNMQGDTSQAQAPSDSKMAKSCTDERGSTYRMGQKGFKECVQSEKSKHHEQMGGTAEGETESTYKSKEVYKTSPSPTSPER
jgi:hypothetical protein